MNTDVEDVLREGMERFTADLRAPAGLIRRAVRRRRRRLALRSAAGAATALTAGAVALVAVAVPDAGYGAGSATLTADVVKHVNSALSAADPAAIAQMTITTSGPALPGGTATTTTAEEWSYGDQWRSIVNSSAGHPLYDEGFSSSSVYTLVNYQARTWARQPGLGRPAATAVGPAVSPRGCEPVAAGPLLFRTGLPGIGSVAGSLPATVARALRSAVSCGTLMVAGRQHVDGVEAIELTSRLHGVISETIWVSPATYLPVRVVTRSAYGLPALQQTADITWLPPTAQNLAKLTVPVPAGFRQVPLIAAVTPILPHVPPQPLAAAAAICSPLAGPAVRPGPCFRPRLWASFPSPA